MSSEDLKEIEDNAAAPQDERSGAEQSELSSLPEESGNNFSYRNEAKQSFLSGIAKGNGSYTKTGTIVGASMVGVLVIIVVIASIILSQLKVIHFGELLAATGYVRFNGIMQERTTQDIFDASVVKGEGSVQVRGKTLVDRLNLRNVDNQLSQLGREGKFNLELKDDKLVKVKFEGGEVSLDEIAKRYGADSFENIKGWRNKMGARAELVNQLKTSVGENLALEPRYVQGRIFRTIADKVGFKYSRWPNAGRDVLGKKPPEAIAEDNINSVKENGGEGVDAENGVINEAAKEYKNEDRIRKNIESNGGKFNKQQFTEAIESDIAKATKLQDVGSKVSVGAMALSVACMANITFAKAPQIAEQNEASATKMGLQLLAARDQVKADKVTTISYATAAAQLDGAEQSASYQYQAGQPVNLDKAELPKVTPSIDPMYAEMIKRMTSPTQSSALGSIASTIPGLSGQLDKVDEKFCNALLSPEGMALAVGTDLVIQIVVGSLTGGAEAAAEQGAARASVSITLEALGKTLWGTARDLVSVEGATKAGGTFLAFAGYSLALQQVAMAFSGSTFSGSEQGAAYYDRASIGTNVVQNRQIRSLYGRPLEENEVKTVDKKYIAELKDGWNNKGFTQRYFAADNPFSLVGTASVYAPSNLTGGVNLLRNSFGNLGSAIKPFATMGLGLFGARSRVYAAEASSFNPYGDQVQWGFSPDELEKMRSDKTYRITENEKHISQDKISELDGKIGKCFDPAISQYAANKDPDCSADNLKGAEVFRYRLYKIDENIVKSSEEDLTKNDTDTGSSSSSGGATIDPSLPSGSKEELISQIKASGNVTGTEKLSTDMKQTILAVIAKLSQTYKFSIWSTIRPGGPPHGNGSAVDLGNINNKGVPTGNDYAAINEDADKFATDAATLLPGKSWMGVPNDHYKEIANNILRNKGGSSDLDTPWTTRATGAHFHLNCAADAP